MSLSFFEPKRAVRKFCAIGARILPEGERIKEEGFTLTGMRRMDKHGSRMNNSHRAIAHRLKAILLAAAILPILWACSRSPMARPLEREDLFELDFGDFQTQITAQGISAPVMDLAMSQGIFTLLDGSGKKATRFTSFGDVLSIVAPPDSPLLESPTLVSSGYGDVLYVADRQSREATPVVDKFSGASDDWVVRKFSSDGKYLAAGLKDYFLVYELPGGNLIQTIDIKRGSIKDFDLINTIAFNFDNSELAVSTFFGNVYFFSTKDWSVKKQIGPDSYSNTAELETFVTLSPDGKYFVLSYGWKKEISIYSAKDYSKLTTVTISYEDGANNITFSKDGKTMLVAVNYGGPLLSFDTQSWPLWSFPFTNTKIKSCNLLEIGRASCRERV